MKLTVGSIFLSILFSSRVDVASSLTIHAHSKTSKPTQFNAVVQDAVGSAYFISNEVTGNYVFAADISSNGSLSLREAYPTGGMGLHGNNSGSFTGPDGLFSQGSIVVNDASNLLATVNPGSATISLFSIDPSDSSNLTLVGEPIGSGGQFPVSVTFNKVGDTVCALNGGEINGVSCFKVNQTLGLQPLAGTTRMLPLDQVTPANGFSGTVSQVIFSPDEKQLLALVKGPSAQNPGYIAAWDIASNGSLSSEYMTLSLPSGGALPFSMTPVPGKNAFVFSDVAIGCEIIDLDSSNKSVAVALPNQTATCWSTYSSRTGSYYLIDALGTVYEVSVDDNLNGTLVGQYPQPVQGTGILDGEVASLSDNDYMYIIAAGGPLVEVFSLNAPGQAKLIGALDIITPATAAGIAISNSAQGMATYVKH